MTEIVECGKGRVGYLKFLILSEEVVFAFLRVGRLSASWQMFLREGIVS